MHSTAKEIVYKKIPGPLDTDCMICTSHKVDNGGYVRIMRNGKRQLLHRYLYQLMYLQAMFGIVIHHACENKLCINVEHLKPKSDFAHRSDHHKGELAHGSKLTEHQVREILADTKHLHRELAEIYGTNRSNISRIKRGERWKWLSREILYGDKLYKL